MILPPEEEVRLGREIAKSVEESYELHRDPLVQRYVSEIAEEVGEATGDPRPEITWTVKVIDAPDTINAIALPGGWIYLHSGLLLAMENEAELVAVIGHEMAHVNLRHIADRLATIYGVETLIEVALGRDPGTFERIVATILAQGYLLRYSRSQEREADQYAIEYSIEAGWDPRGLAWFFERMESSPRPPEWLSTHPSPQARVEQVYERVAGRRIPTRTGEQRYQEMRGRLVPEADSAQSANSEGGWRGLGAKESLRRVELEPGCSAAAGGLAR